MTQAKLKAMGEQEQDVVIEDADAAPEPDLVDEDDVMLGTGEVEEQEQDPLHEHVFGQ